MNVMRWAAVFAANLLMLVFVSAAGRAIGMVASATSSCNSTVPCQTVTNAGSGGAIKGSSAGGYGLIGGTSSGKAGVFGQTSTSYGVWGNATTTGTGVEASSTHGTGLVALSKSGDGAHFTGSNGYGLVGSGIYGGVFYGHTAAGAYAESDTSAGIQAVAEGSGTAFYGSSVSGRGVDVYVGGSPGGRFYTTNGNGIDATGTYAGIVGRAPANGYPLILTDSNGNNVFFVTGGGYVRYHGDIGSFMKTRDGGTAMAYGAKATTPGIEDTGTSTLRNGVAIVYFDGTFAQSIDTSKSYQVFLTPGGDTRGLYVARKDARGFIVREVQGGRGSFDFDYRVYATPLGSGNKRMHVESPSDEPHAPTLPVTKPNTPKRPK